MNINIYADESCHLQNDKNDIMVLGCIQCPEEMKDIVYSDIRKLKLKHGMSTWNEVKWTKVSNNKVDFYIELIDYFINEDNIKFRSVVATGKKLLDIENYHCGDYDVWYYKMYYYLFNKIIYPKNIYRIFIDIKDTRGQESINELQAVLCNSKYDFTKEYIKDIRKINSKESELMQLADILMGAISYYNRGLYEKNIAKAKNIIINKLIEFFGEEAFRKGTKYSEEKFNIFIWGPRC